MRYSVKAQLLQRTLAATAIEWQKKKKDEEQAGRREKVENFVNDYGAA